MHILHSSSHTKSLKYSYGASQFRLATFQGFSSCMWPGAALLDSTAPGQPFSPSLICFSATAPLAPRLTHHQNL